MPPHCDSMDGPVVTAARRALEAHDVSFVLPFVKKDGEDEVVRAFKASEKARRHGAEAREVADLYFFETVVRVHRAGEGAPYTGLKPAGLGEGPVIPVAEFTPRRGASRGIYSREEGLEFGRIVTFSDGIFAVAMTLIVVGIAVPEIGDGDLRPVLERLAPQIMSFFISFFVIGVYWYGHHRFFSALQAADALLIALNVTYLAAIAFIPLPCAIMDLNQTSPIGAALYAANLGIASAVGTAMVVHARRRHLLRPHVQHLEYHRMLVKSSVPIGAFALSIPFAFLVSAPWAPMLWVALFPTLWVIDRSSRSPSA